MTMNLIFHARTKYIEIEYHFFREKVALGTGLTVCLLFYKALAKAHLSIANKQAWHGIFTTLQLDGE